MRAGGCLTTSLGELVPRNTGGCPMYPPSTLSPPILAGIGSLRMLGRGSTSESSL